MFISKSLSLGKFEPEIFIGKADLIVTRHSNVLSASKSLVQISFALCVQRIRSYPPLGLTTRSEYSTADGQWLSLNPADCQCFSAAMRLVLQLVCGEVEFAQLLFKGAMWMAVHFHCRLVTASTLPVDLSVN